MYRSDDTTLRADMRPIPFAPLAPFAPPRAAPAAPAAPAAREGARAYTLARSAATRPVLSVAAFRAGRRTRALQLSWVGLVRR